MKSFRLDTSGDLKVLDSIKRLSQFFKRLEKKPWWIIWQGIASIILVLPVTALTLGGIAVLLEGRMDTGPEFLLFGLVCLFEYGVVRDIVILAKFIRQRKAEERARIETARIVRMQADAEEQHLRRLLLAKLSGVTIEEALRQTPPPMPPPH